MATKARFTGKVRDDYLEMIQEFPLASIRSEKQFKAAQEFIDQILVKKKLSKGEEMYLDALSDLVATYEDQHYSIDPSSDADMLRHLMEIKEKSQADLHRETGISKSSISEILAGKKPFSRKLIRKLADYFGVDVSVLTANL